MADVIFVALVLGFFALAVGLVSLCERIVGLPGLTSFVAPEAPRSPDADAEGGVAA